MSLLKTRVATAQYNGDELVFRSNNFPVGVDLSDVQLQLIPSDKSKTYYANLFKVSGGNYKVTKSVDPNFTFGPFVEKDKAYLCIYSLNGNSQEAIRCINQMYVNELLEFDTNSRLESNTLYGTKTTYDSFEAFTSFKSDDATAFFVMSEKDFIANKGKQLFSVLTVKIDIDTNKFDVLNDKYVLLSHVQELRDLAVTVLTKKSDKSVSILVEGETGNGKSSFIENFCAHYNVPFFPVYINSVVPDDPYGAFGNSDLENATAKIIYHKADIKHDGKTFNDVESIDFIFGEQWQDVKRVFFFDEFNRSKPALRNMMYQLMNNDSVQIKGVNYKRPRNLMIYIAANMGYDNVDTELVDSAFINRFSFIHDLKLYPIPKDEILAMLKILYGKTIEKRVLEALVEAINKIVLTHNLKASLRDYIQICDLLEEDVNFAYAVRSVFINKKVYAQEIEYGVAKNIQI